MREMRRRGRTEGDQGRTKEKNKARQGIRRSERQRPTDKQKEQNEQLKDDKIHLQYLLFQPGK